jgi:glucokinase
MTGRRQIFIALDLGGTSFKAGVVSSAGQVIGRTRRPTPKSEDYQEILSTILGLFKDLEAICPSEVDVPKCGVAVGVPGLVSPPSGDVTDCFNIFGKRYPTVHLGRDLRELTGREVRVDRDVNLAALGEHWMGAGKGQENLVCVFIGTGIGGGIIMNGQLIRGSLGAAGEFGHITVERNGSLCGCGNRGCVEQYASGTAIARRFFEATRAAEGYSKLEQEPTEGKATRQVFDLAKSGDPLATRVIDEACKNLGLAIANVVTLLGPDLVVLGGGVARQFDFIVTRVRAEIRARCRPAVYDACSLVASALWDDAALVGGAKLFIAPWNGGQG